MCLWRDWDHLCGVWVVCAGEGFNDRIDAFVAGALEYYDKVGTRTSLKFPLISFMWCSL